MSAKKRSKEEKTHASDAVFAALAKNIQPPASTPAANSAPALNTPSSGRQRVSLCMIVKNEEKNLADCLNCVKDLVDEMIIVDTGSTDRTKEIAASFGAKLFDFPWVDSFAAARNESLRHATGDWIFWMDADDRIDEENRQKLRALFAELKDENVGYLITCRVLPGDPEKPIRIVDHTRVFRNHPQIRWHYRVHEQILPAIHQTGGTHKHTDIVVVHVGYQDRSLSVGKLQRNLKLLQLDVQDNPNDPFTLYNLGRGYERLEQTAEAIKHWRRSLSYVPPTETYVARLYSLLAQAYSKLNKRSDMLTICLAGLARYPENVELLFWSAWVLFEVGDLYAAEASLLRILQSKTSAMAIGDDVGMRTFRTHQLLGRIYRDMKRPADAEKHWRVALEEDPDFAQALLGLGQLYLDQERWQELTPLLSRLEANPQAQVETVVLKGLLLVKRNEVAAAIKLTREATARFPGAVEPLILLGRLLLREKDVAGAEATYRKLLSLDANNAEAQRALAKIQAAANAAAAPALASASPVPQP